MSALLKTFLERLFPATAPGLESGKSMELERLAIRDGGKGPSSAALLAVGAMRSLRTMDGAVASFELICNGIGARPAGKLLRPESFFLDFAAGKPITAKKVRQAIESAGRELVLDGQISQETEQNASLPFTHDKALFRRHFATYWEIASEIGAFDGDRGKIASAASKDLRILMHELAACFDPVAAGDLRAVIRFDISNGTDAADWFLNIEEGVCTATLSHDGPADLTLKMPENTLIGIILAQQDPRTALSSGAMKVDGPTSLLARFTRLFPPPNS